MGVKSILSLFEIREILKDYSFKIDSIYGTKNGVSDTVYILFTNKGKFLFKLYESASFKEVESEISLLEIISSLPVPKVISDKNLKKIGEFREKFFVVYSFLEGESLSFANEIHLKEIGEFLGKFHSLSENISIDRENRFTVFKTKELLDKVDRIDKEPFKRVFREIKNLKIEQDGLIHGDLFLDNAKFNKERLSGVFDFSDFCRGSFLFDAGVVVASWCFKKEKFNLKLADSFISSYNRFSNKKISLLEVLDYSIFASLFYALRRYERKSENYLSLLKRADILLNVKGYLWPSLL